MNVEVSNNETWQVDAGGTVYETNFAEMADWIAQGSLLRIDRVKKGNLRWIEAGKVPALTEFFNAKDAAAPPPPVVTTSSGANHVDVLGPSTTSPALPMNEDDRPASPAAPADACAVHADAPVAYICDTCCNAFCKACPNSYGGTVRICPFCGAMCKSVAQAVRTKLTEQIWHRSANEKFGFGDFREALAYPLKFKVSLFFGAVMFAFFSLGQSAVSFGGMFMMASSIICFLLANMLTFGVLANTIDNFAQGKIGGNFMPSFDDFSLWDDVVHPFFLSIGIYITSFGPLILTMIVAVFFLLSSMNSGTDGIRSDATRTINPDLPYAANAMQQSQAVKELLNKTNAQQEKRVAELSESPAAFAGQAAPATPAPGPPPSAEDEEKHFQDLNNMIQESRKAQLESAIGKTPETRAKERSALVSKVLGYGVVFLLVAGLCLFWGLFYFPAACCVAGYTRSFVATLNPSVGLDTIKRLGGDYFKILLMGFAVALMSGFISGVLGLLLGAFDLPGVGNLPAKFIGSLFGFYFSVVFSCVLGFAIFKAADRLQLYKG
jgi:hypothetical protein